MINWYRSAMNDLERDRPRRKDRGSHARRLGRKDVALEVSTLDGTDQYVRDLKIVRRPTPRTRVQQDEPEAVNSAIKAFLA